MQPLGAFAGCDQPSIGFRPFEYSDRNYFFGRDDELDVLEGQVKQNRFVAVVGRSEAENPLSSAQACDRGWRR